VFIAEHGGQRSPGEHAMSSRAQHYREAERLLEALPPDKRGDTLAMKARVLTLEEVQVYTMLATVHDDAYSEHVDLKSLEEMRERVGRDARRDVT
jgi:hypothetical protein